MVAEAAVGGIFVVSNGSVRSNGSRLIVSNWEGTSSSVHSPTSPVSAVHDILFSFMPPQVHDNGDDVVDDVRF